MNIVHQERAGELQPAGTPSPAKKSVFFGLAIGAMKSAMEKEFNVQLVLGQGQATLKDLSYKTITDKAFGNIEAKDTEERTPPEEAVMGLGRVRFAAEAKVPIHSWWYQSGKDSGAGKLKREYKTMLAQAAPKRQQVEVATESPAAIGAGRFAC